MMKLCGGNVHKASCREASETDRPKVTVSPHAAHASPLVNMIKLQIEYNESDPSFVIEYQNRVNQLSAVIIEMMEKNPALILSPVFRELMVEKAKELDKYNAKVYGKLHVDNSFAPLKVD